MIAAIYARKSTEQNGTADEAKSVARQVAHARAFAAQKGWTVEDAHVYIDDGISGAEFAKRPGFLRLMNALQPRPPFQVLLMAEESRLGREQIEVAYALKQLAQAGVRVWLYLTGEERRLETALDKMMAALTGFAAEVEREKAAQRTRDALARKARVGLVTGGLVFGYRNVRMATGGVQRLVHEAEAAIVRRIFALAAQGLGTKRIASTLNEDGAPAPRPRRRGAPTGWAPSSVREILHRPLYCGRVVWGRTKKRDAWGQQRPSARPPGDWIEHAAPELRIIEAPLWAAAQAQVTAKRALYHAHSRGRPGGRPPSGVESRYLLTGFGTCGVCGGSMCVLTSDRRAHRVALWGCMTRKTRGRTVCPNVLEVPLEAADAAVLAAVEHDLLRVEVVETALAKALAALEPRADARGDREVGLREDLARLDAEVGRLAAAIAAGGDLAALVAALQERERRCSYVRTELAGLEHERALAFRQGFDRDRVLDEVRAQLSDWQGLLRRETGPARQALRALLTGRLVFTPSQREGAACYTFSGEGTITPVIRGTTGAAMGGVSPAGFEPALPP